MLKQFQYQNTTNPLKPGDMLFSNDLMLTDTSHYGILVITSITPGDDAVMDGLIGKRVYYYQLNNHHHGWHYSAWLEGYYKVLQ